MTKPADPTPHQNRGRTQWHRATEHTISLNSIVSLFDMGRLVGGATYAPPSAGAITCEVRSTGMEGPPPMEGPQSRSVHLLKSSRPSGFIECRNYTSWWKHESALGTKSIHSGQSTCKVVQGECRSIGSLSALYVAARTQICWCCAGHNDLASRCSLDICRVIVPATPPWARMPASTAISTQGPCDPRPRLRRQLITKCRHLDDIRLAITSSS